MTQMDYYSNVLCLSPQTIRFWKEMGGFDETVILSSLYTQYIVCTIFLYTIYSMV